MYHREQDHHLAVAVGKTELYSSAGVGGGSTEREAAVQAINSYFQRKQDAEAAKALPLSEPPAPPESTPMSWPPTPRPLIDAEEADLPPIDATDLPPRPQRCYITPTGIRAVIQQAIRDDDDVVISGVKADGKTHYSRVKVRPLAIKTQRGGSFGFSSEYLLCLNEDGAERNYRLDGISVVVPATEDDARG